MGTKALYIVYACFHDTQQNCKMKCRGKNTNINLTPSCATLVQEDGPKDRKH